MFLFDPAPQRSSSLLLETHRLASKRAQERIHQPDEYTLENVASMLLHFLLLSIMFIKPQMAFGVDHRACFPNLLQSRIRLGDDGRQPQYPSSYLSCTCSWGGAVCYMNVYSEWTVAPRRCEYLQKDSPGKFSAIGIDLSGTSSAVPGKQLETAEPAYWTKKQASFIPRITTSGPAAHQG